MVSRLPTSAVAPKDAAMGNATDQAGHHEHGPQATRGPGAKSMRFWLNTCNNLATHTSAASIDHAFASHAPGNIGSV
jgi:hypothetical protein